MMTTRHYTSSTQPSLFTHCSQLSHWHTLYSRCLLFSIAQAICVCRLYSSHRPTCFHQQITVVDCTKEYSLPYGVPARHIFTAHVLQLHACLPSTNRCHLPIVMRRRTTSFGKVQASHNLHCRDLEPLYVPVPSELCSHQKQTFKKTRHLKAY